MDPQKNPSDSVLTQLGGGSQPDPAASLPSVPASTPSLTPQVPPVVPVGAGMQAVLSSADAKKEFPSSTLPPVAPAMPPQPSRSKWYMLGALLVLVVAIVAGAVWWMQSERSSVPTQGATPISQKSQAKKMEKAPEVNLAQSEGVAELPAVPLENTSEGSKELSGVAGRVCAYFDKFPAGKVIFFNVQEAKLITIPVAQGEYIFDSNIPAGIYTVLYEPDGTGLSLPRMGYTEYVRCGLDPQKCTDHTLLNLKVEAGKQYGSLNICDPQYEDAAMPQALKRNAEKEQQ